MHLFQSCGIICSRRSKMTKRDLVVLIVAIGLSLLTTFGLRQLLVSIEPAGDPIPVYMGGLMLVLFYMVSIENVVRRAPVAIKAWTEFRLCLLFVGLLLWWVISPSLTVPGGEVNMRLTGIGAVMVIAAFFLFLPGPWNDWTDKYGNLDTEGVAQ